MAETKKHRADGVERTAVFSPCLLYRYCLTRVWRPGGKRVLFILLNPSTADHRTDDPTLRRGMAYARAWGYGGLVYCNLFAYRTPSPQEMKKAEDPVGPDNDYYIAEEAQRAEMVVAAWGAHGGHRRRDEHVLSVLAEVDLYALKETKGGHPGHILYLRKDAEPFLYRAARR